jgi:hypothetical protein
MSSCSRRCRRSRASSVSRWSAWAARACTSAFRSARAFGGQKNRIAALKLVAYGATAGFLGGIFNALPSLAVLGMVAALYSIYLFYTGLPVLMRCTADKALAYTAVVVVCAIVAGLVVGLLSAAITPMPRVGVAMQ